MLFRSNSGKNPSGLYYHEKRQGFQEKQSCGIYAYRIFGTLVSRERKSAKIRLHRILDGKRIKKHRASWRNPGCFFDALLEGRITVTRGSNEHLEEVEDALKPLADGSVAAEKNGLTQAMVQELVENVWVGDEITVEFKADSMMRIAEDELVG